jgi:hypothetical protein
MTAVLAVMAVSEVVVIRRVLRIEKHGLEQAAETGLGSRRQR